MGNEITLSEIDIDSQSQELKTSRLAIASAVFGILGPFSSGTMWIVSFNDFLTVRVPVVMALFSCSVAWILGLGLGIKSLEQIANSEGQLAGKQYAIIGIFVSTVWMFLVVVCILLPAIYATNS